MLKTSCCYSNCSVHFQAIARFFLGTWDFFFKFLVVQNFTFYFVYFYLPVSWQGPGVLPHLQLRNISRDETSFQPNILSWINLNLCIKTVPVTFRIQRLHIWPRKQTHVYTVAKATTEKGAGFNFHVCWFR